MGHGVRLTSQLCNHPHHPTPETPSSCETAPDLSDVGYMLKISKRREDQIDLGVAQQAVLCLDGCDLAELGHSELQQHPAPSAAGETGAGERRSSCV